MYVRDLTKILKSQCPSILLRKVTSREYFENGGTCTLRIASMTARNMLGVHSSRPETRSMNPSLPVCSPAVTPLRHALHAERGPLSSARGEAGAPGQEHVIHRAQVLILEAHLQLQKGQCQGGAAMAAESGLGRGVQRVACTGRRMSAHAPIGHRGSARIGKLRTAQKTCCDARRPPRAVSIHDAAFAIATVPKERGPSMGN